MRKRGKREGGREERSGEGGRGDGSDFMGLWSMSIRDFGTVETVIMWKESSC